MPTSAYAASYTVTIENDEADVSPSCVTGSATDCSLREAIRSANASSGSDTIIVPAGTYTLSVSGTAENAAATGDLDITDTSGTLTLTGAGVDETIIDANHIDRVMETLAGTTAVISQLTLTNGTTTGDGAGILALGTTTLDHVTVSNNAMTGSSFGGGIRCENNTLVITNSTISGNTTTAGEFGGAMNANLCNLTISQSAFSNNTASGGGGAIIASIQSNEILIEDSSFTNNSATIGGAIYTTESTIIPAGQMVIRDSTFSNNNASLGGFGLGGGALYIDAPTVVVNTTFMDNTAADNGGAIFVENNGDAHLDISFSTILQNNANNNRSGGGNGGGLFVAGGSADVVVKGSLFAENYQYPDTPTGSTANDCSASAGLASADYNYLATTTDCTGIFTQTHDNTTSGSHSLFFTVSLENNGGPVQTARLWTSNTRDIVPEVDCTDIAGNPLTTDARGLSRPQNGLCDIGAFESDQTIPTVAITSGTDTVQCGIGSWSDAGATATDNFRTGLIAGLSSGTVNASVIGSYPILYLSTLDYDGNQGSNTRTVSVVDTTAPTITQVSAGNVSVTQGQTYTDLGATASDACDASVAVSTTNPVDTAAPGTYTVTYTATDDSSNTTTATRTVTVNAAVARDPEPTPVEENTDHGKITTVTKTNNRVTVVYADAATDTITPYGSSVNFRYALSTDKKRLVVTNGKDIRVFVNGERTAKKAIGTKTLPSAQYRIAVKKVYAGYDSVFIATARQKTARVFAFRLTSGNALTTKKTQQFSITDLSKPVLSVNKAKKQVTVTYGKSGQRVTRTWKLAKNGNFSLQK